MKKLLPFFIIEILFVLSFSQTVRVPIRIPDGNTIYYIQGENIYHLRDCPELVGKNGWASNVYTLSLRNFKPCEKCLFKEIPAPAKKEEIKSTDSKLIARWEGNAQKNTETFAVNSDEWVILWNTNGDSNFAVTVYNADSNRMVELVANIIGSGKDYSVIRGKGRYYLKIITSQPYVIEVREPIK